MEIESKELQEYIKSSITAIKKGVEGTNFRIIKPIEFNLAVTNTVEGGGGLKIYIAKAEGKLKSEEISHIKFEVQPKPELAQIIYPTTSRRNPGR
jgi:hypothetical protein